MSPLGSDTSRFITFHVRFSSLQLYSRSNHTAHRSLTSLTDFSHFKKCHMIVVFAIAQRLIHLSTRRSLITNQLNSIIAEQFLTEVTALNNHAVKLLTVVINIACYLGPS